MNLNSAPDRNPIPQSRDQRNYYLRVEAVNFKSFMDDTNNLSVIRGASLALLNAVNDLAPTPDTQPFGQSPRFNGIDLQPISLGSSTGIFRFQTESDEMAEHIRKEVEACMRQATEDVAIRYATFTVSCVPEPMIKDSQLNPYEIARENMNAVSQWKKMQSGGLVLDTWNKSKGVMACEFDNLRADLSQIERREDEPESQNRRLVRNKVSGFTKLRHDYGRKQKQAFYEQWSDVKPDEFLKPLIEYSQSVSSDRKPPDRPLFSIDFEEIALVSHRDKALESLPTRLGGKMAVFYADGNHFGKVEHQHARTPEDHREFDVFIRDQRRKLLSRLLRNEILRDQAWINPNCWSYQEQRDTVGYRFETLTWAGDEMLFVMPAWKGWQFATEFYASMEALAQHMNSKGMRDMTMTSALVFCHHQAPIRRIKHLVQNQLAQFAKVECGRENHQLAYQVLDSFDNLGTDLVKSWEDQTGRRGDDLKRLVLRPNSQGKDLSPLLKTFTEAITTFRDNGFSKSRLRDMALRLSRGQEAPEWNTVLTRFTGCLSIEQAKGSDIGQQMEKLKLHLGEGWSFWVHLEELWDYAAPLKQ